MYKILFVVILSITISYQTTVSASKVNKIIANFAPEPKQRILTAVRQCAGNDTKMIEYIKIVGQGKVLEDEDFKKFIHCSYSKSGYSYEDGRVNIELSAPLYPDPAIILEVLKRCDEERGDTPVETTFAFFKCFQQRSPFLIGI